MKIMELSIKGVFEITLDNYTDFRGGLHRTYDENEFENAGISTRWLQESYSHTQKANTLRGFHVSLPPNQEGKLITPINGVMLWVVIDLRTGSETFGESISFELRIDELKSIYVSRGFAHGCLSLTDSCSLIIKSDNSFSETNSTGIVWDDPDLNIRAFRNLKNPVISKRDMKYPDFKEFKERFGGI